MLALLVYESMFGNTEAIAEAVAEGIGGQGVVEVREVGTRPVLGPEVELLVVGGPTHAFGLTRASTRTSAKAQAEDGHVVSEGIGIREWLDELPETECDPLVAAFDTRVAPARVPGSAAKGIARRLRSHGYDLVLDPHTFWVEGTSGPLVEGELDVAREWGAHLRVALPLTRP
jgi:hypothetical protein